MRVILPLALALALCVVRVAVPGVLLADAVPAEPAGRAGREAAGRVAERLLVTAPIPAHGTRHGEAALIVRDGIGIVQVFLHSGVLRRVVAEIAAKEAAAWANDPEGAEQSRLYVDALRSAEREVSARHRRADERREHPIKLVIEIVPGRDVAAIDLYELPVSAPVQRASLARKSRLRRLELERGYVERTFYLVAADALDLSVGEVRERVRAAGGTTPEPAPPVINRR